MHLGPLGKVILYVGNCESQGHATADHSQVLELPTSSIETEFVASGAPHSCGRERGNALGTLVRLRADSAARVAVLELNDEKRFNWKTMFFK